MSACRVLVAPLGSLLYGYPPGVNIFANSRRSLLLLCYGDTSDRRNGTTRFFVFTVHVFQQIVIQPLRDTA